MNQQITERDVQDRTKAPWKGEFTKAGWIAGVDAGDYVKGNPLFDVNVDNRIGGYGETKVFKTKQQAVKALVKLYPDSLVTGTPYVRVIYRYTI